MYVSMYVCMYVGMYVCIIYIYPFWVLLSCTDPLLPPMVYTVKLTSTSPSDAKPRILKQDTICSLFWTALDPQMTFVLVMFLVP